MYKKHIALRIKISFQVDTCFDCISEAILTVGQLKNKTFNHLKFALFEEKN